VREVAARAGSWLEGPGGTSSRPAHPAAALGLPAAGPGSVATVGRRAAGYLLDAVAAVLVGLVMRAGGVSGGAVGLAQSGLVLLEIAAGQSAFGRSLGQALVGTRLVSVHGGGRPRPWWVLLRTFLLVLPVPGVAALVTDDDGRGLHDRAAGTVVVLA